MPVNPRDRVSEQVARSSSSDYIVITPEETMRARIIRIGNSQGIRIPKPLLERSGLSGEVELEVSDNQIIIRAPDNPRAGWDEAFREMHARGDDELLDGNHGTSSWDDEEWVWE